MKNDFFAKVAMLKNSSEVVINKGSDHNVKIGDKFIIYTLGEEVIDPDSGESLGALEEIKGNAIVKHVQEKMATLESNDFIKENDKTEIVRSKRNSIASLYLGGEGTQETTKIIPGNSTRKDFDWVKVGDLVKKK